MSIPSHLLFWVEEVVSWPLPSALLLCLGIVLAMEVLSYVTFAIAELLFSTKLPPSGHLIQRRDATDFLYISLNKLSTVVFTVDVLRTLYPLPPPPPTLLTVLAPIPLLFAAYDLLYAPFHAFLHWGPVYPWVHKHHHRQVSPHRGLEDAINTHWFEYASGMWMHKWAFQGLALAGLPIHPAAMLLFVGLGSVAAAFNHTRSLITLPFLYASSDHDTHHRFSSFNYGQYVTLWDKVCGTFQEWTPPPPLSPRPPPPEATPLPCLPPSSLPVGDAPKRCAVTGGNGLVGARLVTMLIERGAQHVVSIDTALPPSTHSASGNGNGSGSASGSITHEVCDITSPSALECLTGLFKGCDAVFHVAALVGPGFPAQAYKAVNHTGTLTVMGAVEAAGVPVVVLTSSPTILLRGGDGEGRVYNARECDLNGWGVDRGGHLHPYSLTKSDGTEAALTLAWGDGSHSTAPVRLCAIAPHQVYGPADRLFMPNLLGAAAQGRLRVFGPGDNLISMCHTDNCAHAHILAAAALARGVEGVAGEVFVVTDTGAVFLWDAIGRAVGECGLLPDWGSRAHLGRGLLWVAGQGAALASALWVRVGGGRAFHFSPFSIRMLLIHRFFNVDKAVTRLGYAPLVAHDTAWPAVARAVWERMQVEGGGGPKNKHI